MIFLKVTLFILALASIEARPRVDDSTQEYEDSMNSLVSRLTSSNNRTENLAYMPAFSVDIVSLLRWTIETQLQNQAKSRHRRTYNKNTNNNNSSPEYYYPTDFLSLVEYESKSYFFSKNQKLTFIEAISYCRAFGMDLVSIESKEEDEFLIKEIETLGLTGTYVWISANKIGRSSFMWVNGEPMVYENWASGNPGSPATEHCAVIQSKKWYDVLCANNVNHSYEAFFICEER